MNELFNPAEYVRVTNKDETSVERGRKIIRGRFDGRDYIFPFEKPVDIPIVAAVHIFGFGLDDKSTAFARLGWVRNSGDLDVAYERMRKVLFQDLPPLMEVPSESLLLPLDPSGKAASQDGAAQAAPEGKPRKSKEAM